MKRSMTTMINLRTVSISIFLVLPSPAPAPVPRCSPFIFINKLAEWTNVWSDSNPYFPVPPCEYGGPVQALAKGDLKSVFVTYEPTKISLHNFYEFVWLLKTGIPRMLRILAGTEQFIYDTSILKEGYQHYTPNIRTEQIGHKTDRRPEIIDNFKTYKAIVSNKIDRLAKEGPDRYATAFTPLGDLPARSVLQPQYTHLGEDKTYNLNFENLEQSLNLQQKQAQQPFDLTSSHSQQFYSNQLHPIYKSREK